MIFEYTSKPTIIVNVTEDVVDDQWIKQIEYGIEEEGIPYSRDYVKSTNLVTCAHEAATKSLLLVGIACDKHDAVLHYRTLKQEQFLYRIKNYSRISAQELRHFGSNAARLVKGIPFKKLESVEVSF